MTVYVDDMNASFGRMTMCHMVADSDEELHAMADKIGVARKWHQNPQTMKVSNSHYDICLTKKSLAIEHGAVSITFRQLGRMLNHKRTYGRFPSIDEVKP